MELDSSSWTEVGVFNFTLVVSLPNFPEVNPMEEQFQVEVIPPYMNDQPIVLGEIYEPKDYITINDPRVRSEQDYLADAIR